jgi:hypothetical protein
MSDIYLRNATVEESPLQGDLMLFDPDQSKFFVLNPTMAFVWQQCDGKTPLQALLAQVPRTFAGTAQSEYATDMRTALDDLLSLGLVARI